MAKKPRNKKYNSKKLDKWATRVAERGTMLIQAQGLAIEAKCAGNLFLPMPPTAKRFTNITWRERKNEPEPILPLEKIPITGDIYKVRRLEV